MHKRFSQACENNKTPILDALRIHFADHSRVLEIGSGTGQHAAFLGANLGHLVWMTSDMPANHPSIRAWLAESDSANIVSPVDFTVGLDEWPASVDAVFTANTAHIMQKAEVELMMQLVGRNLPPNGVFCQYGPFNVDGQYTSQSNALFDSHLMAEGCGGIRDIGELQNWAKALTLKETVSMPANNFMLVWERN